MCMLFRVMKMKMNICKINKMNKMMAFLMMMLRVTMMCMFLQGMQL